MRKESYGVKEFGLSGKKVIFFFAGMGTRTWVYRRPIKRLVKDGYHVIAYDFHPLIVRNGDTDSFLKTADDTMKDVSNRIKFAKNKGVKKFYAFGVSMGTLMAIKAAADLREISKVVINMTYGSVAENVWTWWFIKPAKNRAIKQGYTMESLDKRLKPISPIPNAKMLKDKKVLLYLSRKDKVLLFSQSSQFRHALDKANVDYEYIENNKRGHVGTGYTNFKNYHIYHQFLAQ